MSSTEDNCDIDFMFPYSIYFMHIILIYSTFLVNNKTYLKIKNQEQHLEPYYSQAKCFSPNIVQKLTKFTQEGALG